MCLFIPVLPEGNAVAFDSNGDEKEDRDGNCTVACNDDKKGGRKKQRCHKTFVKESTLPLLTRITTSTQTCPSTHSPLVAMRWSALKEAPLVVVLGNSTCSWFPA